MLKSRIWLFTLVIFLFASLGAYGQQPQTAKRCNLLLFDRELKNAAEESDAGKVALLVSYPLRVNDSRGSYYIKDARTLQGRFGDIFTPSVRKAISSQKIDNSACNTDRVMYGNGDVWVWLTDQGYAITVVNLPGQQRPAGAAEIQATCRTGEIRIIVDKAPGGALRYRAWDKGHSLMQKPDTELTDGKETMEGTGVCTHRLWSFGRYEKNISVEEIGCTEDSPPANAIGRLVTSAGSTWCF